MQRCAITDRSLLTVGAAGLEGALGRQVGQWVDGGVEWVQLREKDLPEQEIAAIARSLATVAHRAGSATRLIVNGLSQELASACGADGVHLPGGATEQQVRAAVRVAGTVSVSCHSLQEIRAARDGGAVIALWAPVFEKTVAGVGVQQGTGLERLHAACQEAASMAVFALGGVSIATAAACVQEGAAGIAGIRLFHDESSKGWRALR